MENKKGRKGRIKYDVVVCGGGISGTMAAVAAAREGCKTLLVERFSALGGMATLGLVQPISTWGINNRYSIAGTGAELMRKMALKDKCAATPMNLYGVVCDSEFLKKELEDLALEHGVEILYHTVIMDCFKDKSGCISRLIAYSKGGSLNIEGGVYVDGTGDADVSASAGVPCAAGSQGISLMFIIAGVERAGMPARDEISRIWDKHRVNYRGLTYFTHPRGGALYINMAEVEGPDVLNPAGLTEATIKCRRQAWEIHGIFRKHVPGFENSYISQIAPALGVRESRRIKGRYVLSGEDILNGREFDDVIARGCSPVDIHGSSNSGKGDYRGLRRSYAVPYRALITKEIPNLVVAGRCISSDRIAFSSVRRMAPGFAVGEAAGLAAAISATGSRRADKISVAKLQEKLLSHGAILESES